MERKGGVAGWRGFVYKISAYCLTFNFIHYFLSMIGFPLGNTEEEH